VRGARASPAPVGWPQGSGLLFREGVLETLPDAGRPYRLWIRGKPQGDRWSNDSAHVQFSGSVDANGTPVYRIGTTSSTECNLESCSGCGLAGWGRESRPLVNGPSPPPAPVCVISRRQQVRTDR
jgi:hypothetical protein